MVKVNDSPVPRSLILDSKWGSNLPVPYRKLSGLFSSSVSIILPPESPSLSSYMSETILFFSIFISDQRLYLYLQIKKLKAKTQSYFRVAVETINRIIQSP